MNAEPLYDKLLGVLRKRLERGSFELAGLAMGGAWITERLAQDLSLQHYGIINVAFHRDDYAEKALVHQQSPACKLVFCSADLT